MDQDLQVTPPPVATAQRGSEQSDLLEQFVDQLYEAVPDLNPNDRERIEAFAERMRLEHGGGETYIRKRVAGTRRERALALFNGRNTTEVARELGVSRATVYRLLKQPG